MSSKFLLGFEKTAGAITAPLKYVAKKALGAAGGPLTAAMTGLGIASDAQNIGAKFQAAREGNL